MFADLMDKEIQPKSIDVRYLPEIEISDGFKNEIQEVLEKRREQLCSCLWTNCRCSN